MSLRYQEPSAEELIKTWGITKEGSFTEDDLSTVMFYYNYLKYEHTKFKHAEKGQEMNKFHARFVKRCNEQGINIVSELKTRGGYIISFRKDVIVIMHTISVRFCADRPHSRLIVDNLAEKGIVFNNAEYWTENSIIFLLKWILSMSPEQLPYLTDFKSCKNDH